MFSLHPILLSLLANGLLSLSQKYLASLSRTTAATYYQPPQQQAKGSSAINWRIRPATLEDAEVASALIYKCFSTILPQDYTSKVLEGALPRITTARHQLLTCGTWYLALHPDTNQVVGCGGWTRRKPPAAQNNTSPTDRNEPASSLNSSSKAIPTLSSSTDDEEEDDSLGRQQEKEPPPPLPPAPQLRHFACDPDWTRRGVASAIWRQIEQDMATRSDLVGQDNVTTLEVFSTLTGESFYASKGFVSIQRIEMQLDRDCLFPVIFMRRRNFRCSSVTNDESCPLAS